MNKQIRNKYVVLLIGLIIAVVSTIMSPVSANNNSLNNDCVAYVDGVIVYTSCSDVLVRDWTQNAYSESDLVEDPC